MTMLQSIGFLVCVGQHAFRLGRQRKLNRSRNFFTKEGAPLDFLTNRLNRHLGTWKKTPGQRLVLAHQPQKEMFRFDCRCAKLGSFVSREKNYSSCFFGITFEHLPCYRRITWVVA